MPWAVAQPAPADTGLADTAAFVPPAADSAAAHGHDQAYVSLLSAVPPRVLTYAALGLVAGAAAWRLWLAPRAGLAERAGAAAAGRAQAAVALAGGLGAGAGLAASAWTLAAQLGTLGADDGEPAAMLGALVWHTHWGRAWLAQALAFAAAALGFRAARRREAAAHAAATAGATPDARGWGVALAGGLAAAALQGALGHAAASGDATPVALALAAVHVAAAALWLGTLAVMAGAWRLVPRGDGGDGSGAVGAQLAAFFPLALAAAGTTALAGAANAWLRLGGAAGAGAPGVAGVAARVAALAETDYGRLLAAKLAGAAVVAGAGAVNAWGGGAGARRRAVAAGRDAPAVPAAALDRTTRVELLAAAVVLALSAALAVSTPPGSE